MDKKLSKGDRDDDEAKGSKGNGSGRQFRVGLSRSVADKDDAKDTKDKDAAIPVRIGLSKVAKIWSAPRIADDPANFEIEDVNSQEVTETDKKQRMDMSTSRKPRLGMTRRSLPHHFTKVPEQKWTNTGSAAGPPGAKLIPKRKIATSAVGRSTFTEDMTKETDEGKDNSRSNSASQGFFSREGGDSESQEVSSQDDTDFEVQTEYRSNASVDLFPEADDNYVEEEKSDSGVMLPCSPNSGSDVLIHDTKTSNDDDTPDMFGMIRDTELKNIQPEEIPLERQCDGDAQSDDDEDFKELMSNPKFASQFSAPATSSQSAVRVSASQIAVPNPKTQHIFDNLSSLKRARLLDYPVDFMFVDKGEYLLQNDVLKIMYGFRMMTKCCALCTHCNVDVVENDPGFYIFPNDEEKDAHYSNCHEIMKKTVSMKKTV